MEEDNQLSTEQLLLLENLTYLVNEKPLQTLVEIEADYTKRYGEGNSMPVSYVLNAIKTEDLNPDHNYGSLMTGEDWSNIIQAIEKDDTLCQMKVLTVEEQKTEAGPKVECSSVLSVNEQTNEAVVAFRGTAPYEWEDNFLGGAETDQEDRVSTQYQVEALEWFEGLHLEDGGYDTITLTGHSKGGNKAKYITIMDKEGLVDRCVSFDGQGFSDEFYEEYGKEIARNQWKITNHNVDYDFVNLLLNDVGKTVYYQGYDYGAGMIAEAHCPNTFFDFGKDGTARMNPVEGQAAPSYWTLEKNRVFDMSKLTLLGSTGKALMDTGSQACSEWEDAV